MSFDLTVGKKWRNPVLKWAVILHIISDVTSHIINDVIIHVTSHVIVHVSSSLSTSLLLLVDVANICDVKFRHECWAWAGLGFGCTGLRAFTTVKKHHRLC